MVVVSCTYPTNDSTATATPSNQIASALPDLARLIGSSQLLHVKPVDGTSAISQHRIGIDRKVFIGAMQGRNKEHLAVLQEVPPYLPAGSRQVIERVQVNGGSQRHDDTGYGKTRVSNSPLPFA